MATSTTLSMNQFATTPMYELMDTEEAKKSFYGGRHAYTYHWIETMRNNIILLEKRSGFSPGIVFKERPTKTILVTDTNGVERPRRNPNYVSDADWNDICVHVTSYFRRHISAEHHHLISDVEPGDVAGMQEAMYGPVVKESFRFTKELDAEIKERPLKPNAPVEPWINHQLTMFEHLQELAKSRAKVGDAQPHIMREE